MSDAFVSDLSRSTYVINGKLISQPGTEQSVALKNLSEALTSNGKLDRQGLYAISKFANQSMLARPTLLMNERMNQYFQQQFFASDVGREIHYDITHQEGSSVHILARHTRQINKIADDIDRNTWIPLGQSSYSTCYTEIHLDRATINNIDALIDRNKNKALAESHSGYKICLDTPTSYLEALSAMDQEGRWSLFSSYAARQRALRCLF